MSYLSQAFENRTVHASGEDSRAATLVEYFKPRRQARLARERAGGIVRDAIIAGRLSPGTRLVERELCEALGVSRTVVREVIRDLEAERLLEATAHRGPSVARLTPKLVREIYEVRTELEAMFVRAYVVVAKEDDITTLKGILAELRGAGELHDKAALVELITRFLRHMVAVADNQVGAEIFDQLLARINRLRMLSMGVPGQIEASIVEVGQLVDRIVARDATGADKVLRRYTARARDSALRQLAAQQADCPPAGGKRRARSAVRGKPRRPVKTALIGAD